MHEALSVKIADLFLATEVLADAFPPAEGEVVGAEVVLQDLLPLESMLNIHK